MNQASKKYTQIGWIARILMLFIITFVSLFALDSFDQQLTMIEQLTGFLIHLIPSLILVAMWIIAWKKPALGGYAFLILGLVLAPYLFVGNYSSNHSILNSLSTVLVIPFPILLAGILFIWSSKGVK